MKGSVRKWKNLAETIGGALIEAVNLTDVLNENQTTMVATLGSHIQASRSRGTGLWIVANQAELIEREEDNGS